MAQENLEVFDIPGVGELRARPGTSTAELAGAVKFWHDKAESARFDGFISGAATLGMFELIVTALYFLLR